jgi:peptide/nickel transport system permease protein
MVRFVLVRLGLALVTLVGMSVLVFTVLRSSGDPVSLYLPMTASAEQRTELRHELGLDKWLPGQYADFAAKSAKLDFGKSIAYHLPVWRLISDGLWASIRLTLAAIAFAFVVGVALGVASAVRRGGWFDRIGRTVALLGMSVPSFWLGIVLILVFSTKVHWFPAGGDHGLRSIVLPAITLSLFPMAGWVKITRSAMAEVLQSDYVVLERLSGFRPRRITWKYALKNVMVPAVSFLGLVLGPTVGGAVVVETIFSWPGIGRLAVNAITQRDYPVVQGITLVITAIVVLVSVLVDIAYGVIDPRLSRG